MQTRTECGWVRLASAGTLLLAALAVPVAGQVTSRVSVATGGAQGNLNSVYSSISPEGRYVAFRSDASNLVPGDTNATVDVFVHDRQSGTTERVSVDSAGAQGNYNSYVPSISADGRYVAFASNATNLVSGDTNAMADVFVHDRQSGTTERVSVDSGGAQGSSFSSLPSISADGRYVAFVSGATNLISGDTNGTWDIFVHDRLLGTTERVNVDSSGAQGTTVYSYGNNSPAISADGRYVAFGSLATNLVSGDTNANWDGFVHDRHSGVTERVSVDSSGAQANDASGGYNGEYGLCISANGQFVAFGSRASNLVSGDTNLAIDVFVRDRRLFSTFCFGDGLDTSHTASCPCGNTGAVGNGCASSVNAGGAHLAPTGTIFADDVTLVGTGMPATSSCIYLQGDALEDATFGDGVRCAGGSLIRLGTRLNVAGMSTFPDFTDTVSLSTRGGVTPFSNVRRYYQTYYRNSAATFCPPLASNITNGVIIDW